MDQQLQQQQRFLLDFDDHCLLTIATYLPADDLSSLAATCIRLNTIACHAFTRNSKNRQLSIYRMIQAHRSDPKRYLKRYLRNFGHLIRTIDVDHRRRSNSAASLQPYCRAIWQFIEQYCADTLDELKWGNNSLPFTAASISTAGRALFGRLKGLLLYRVPCDSLSFVLPLMQQCNKLHLQGVILPEYLAVNLPNLKDLKLRVDNTFCGLTGGIPPIACVENFLLRHPHLTALVISVHRDIHWKFIGHLAQLETLEIYGDRILYDYDGGPFDTFALPHLKTLIISYDDFGDTVEVVLEKLAQSPAANTLESLKLNEVPITDNLLRVLSQFPQLRVLKLMEIKDFASNHAQALRDVRSLVELEIDYEFNCQNATIYLSHLGAPEKLQHMDIASWTFDGATILALCRFRNLKRLLLYSLLIDDYPLEAHLIELHRLDQLEMLTMHKFDASVSSWLRHLGSVNCLQHLVLSECPADNQLFENLVKFGKLTKLELLNVKDLADVDFDEICKLKELRELRLQGGADDLWSWNGLFEVVRGLPNLDLLKLKNVWSYMPMALDIYMALVDMCRATSKRIQIEFDEEETIDFEALMNENCRMVVDVVQTMH